MPPQDDFRLAWEEHRAARFARRDALLTLALADAGPEDLRWVEPIHAALLQSRPDHLFAGFDGLGEALSNPRVTAKLRRLRHAFPPAKVRRLLFAADVARGPFSHRPPSIAAMLDDLAPPARLPVPRFDGSGLNLPPETPPSLAFYLATLVEIATLLALVHHASAEGRKAA